MQKSALSWLLRGEKMSNLLVRAVRVIFSLGLNGKEALIWWVGVHRAYFWSACRQTSSSVSSVLSSAHTRRHTVTHTLRFNPPSLTHTHTHTHQCCGKELMKSSQINTQHDLGEGEVWQKAHTHTHKLELNILSPCHYGNWGTAITSVVKSEYVYMWAYKYLCACKHLLVCINMRCLCVCICAAVMLGLTFVDIQWHLISL